MVEKATEKTLNYEDFFGKEAKVKRDVGARGTCKKCGGDGHLTFQCRNFLKLAVYFKLMLIRYL